MSRLSNRMIKIGAIGLAAAMLFSHVAYADEVPEMAGVASYEMTETAEASGKTFPAKPVLRPGSLTIWMKQRSFRRNRTK